MNNNYRLQLRHSAEGKNFSTRDEVLTYIDGQLQYGGVSLLPYEPILFYYGEDVEKNTIIMVGLPEGQVNNGKSYFIIDTADLKKQISDIDEKYRNAIEDSALKDSELQKAITDEIEAREKADRDEAQIRSEKDTELEKSIADEAEAREKADNSLQEGIVFTKADLMSIVDACGLIYNDKLSEDRVSYEPDTHDEVIRDSKNVVDAIDKISKFVSNLGKDLKLSVANTDTVNLTITPNEKDGGSIITADVNIAETDGNSKETFDNNIIGKTNEGLYASVSLVHSKKNNQLIFKTSGYINGKFVVDAFETPVDLSIYDGDNGKNTGINVNVDNERNVISADLILSSDKNNILKLEDGEYIVEGLAKNIKYGDSTVAATLKANTVKFEEIEEELKFVKAIDVKGSESSTSTVNVEKSIKGDFTVSNDVKLSTDRSIIIANGGLQANVSATFNETTSKLIINVGNNEYVANLSALAVSGLEKAEYDSATEDIVLTYLVGNSKKTLRIPTDNLVHDLEVIDTDTIDLTLTEVSGGPNRLSAVIKVDKSHADNILTVNSNGLYVSKAFITESVKEESDVRKDADKELKDKIDEVTKLVNANKDAIVEEVHIARTSEKANADAIAQEIKDARAAEKTNADAIANNAKGISDNTKAINDEVSRATKAEEANADAITAEENRAKAAEVKIENAIASEIDRATEKEADLLNEISNSNAKIKENKDTITAEVDRAIKVEKNLTDSVSKNTSDIANETLRATSIEAELTTKLTEEVTRAKAAEEANKTAIETEKARAEHVEADLEKATNKVIEDLNSIKLELVDEISEKANITDVYDKEEILNKLEEYAKTSDVQTKLDEKVNVTDAKNVYATKESLQELKDITAPTEYVDNADNKLANRIETNENAIDNFNLSYDAATSTLAYTDKNGNITTYNLYSGSLIKNGRFDEDSNSIIFTIENAGQESQIVIPVSKLLTDLSNEISANANNIKKINEALTKVSKDWTVKDSTTIDLVKSTIGEKDELTATVRVATSNKQAIQSNDNGLYVSNDLEDYTCVFGPETISGQSAISILRDTTNKMTEQIEKNAKDIEKLSDDVTKNTNDIYLLKENVSVVKDDITSLKIQVGTNTETISKIEKEISKLQLDKIEEYLNDIDERIVSAEENVASMGERLTAFEKDNDNKFKTINASLQSILDELGKIKTSTGYESYTNQMNMSDRLDVIDEEMTKIVDAGLF